MARWWRGTIVAHAFMVKASSERFLQVLESAMATLNSQTRRHHPIARTLRIAVGLISMLLAIPFGVMFLVDVGRWIGLYGHTHYSGMTVISFPLILISFKTSLRGQPING